MGKVIYNLPFVSSIFLAGMAFSGGWHCNQRGIKSSYSPNVTKQALFSGELRVLLKKYRKDIGVMHHF